MFSVERACKLGARIYGSFSRVKITNVQYNHSDCREGSLFLAMPGKFRSGNDFVKQAIKNGAVAIVSNMIHKDLDKDFPQVVAAHVADFVIRYAADAREDYKKPVICTSGGAGKTTLKNMLALALGPNVLSSRRSYNIKLSISTELLILNNNFDFCILEVGTSSHGEMEDIARIIKPDFLVYGSIGIAHSEFLGSEIDIIKEESAITRYTKKLIIGPSSIENLSETAVFVDEKSIPNFYKINEEKYHISNANTLIATKNTYNKVFFISWLFNLQEESLVKKIKKWSPTCLRGNKIETAKHKIFDLSFNAGPISIANIIVYIKELKEDCDFIFGKMLELGNLEEECHKKAADLLMENPYIKNVYTVNMDLSKYGNKFSMWKNENMDKLEKNVCIHGSRANHLISIVCSLIEDKLVEIKHRV